jgi:hypothetical protein
MTQQSVVSQSTDNPKVLGSHIMHGFSPHVKEVEEIGLTNQLCKEANDMSCLVIPKVKALTMYCRLLCQFCLQLVDNKFLYALVIEKISTHGKSISSMVEQRDFPSFEKARRKFYDSRNILCMFPKTDRIQNIIEINI